MAKKSKKEVAAAHKATRAEAKHEKAQKDYEQSVRDSMEERLADQELAEKSIPE